jgi:hypothetical protein
MEIEIVISEKNVKLIVGPQNFAHWKLPQTFSEQS